MSDFVILLSLHNIFMPHFFLAILHSLGVSQKKLSLISPEQAENFYETVNIHKLLQIGINQETATKIVDKKITLNVERVERLMQEKNIRIVHKDNDEYPSLLKEISDAPTILYVRWQLPSHDALLSVVGSRKHSNYSESCLEKILPDMIHHGYVIVSWWAYGIDAAAHQIALKNGGQTLVVFGAGVDVTYPIAHTQLFEEVVAWGWALLSQFPLGMLSEPFNFPIRNTVVAGMSRGTLIAEAGEDSGTLITARLALEYNRDVFVIPADITREGARGSNALIRDGLGKLVLSAEDILSEYQIVDKQLSLLTTMRPEFADPIQEKLYEILCRDSCNIDALADQTEYELTIIMNALGSMEIDGIVENSGGIYRII